MGLHLLAPSKEQRTGDVIAELTAGEEVGDTGEKRRMCRAWCSQSGAVTWLLCQFKLYFFFPNGFMAAKGGF